MKFRELGRTHLKISDIGFGAWGIGKKMWGTTDDAESLRALRKAMDLEINFFDTAYVYGNGHSERLIAQAFVEAGKKARVASKIPAKNFAWPAKGPLAESFPPEWIIRCTERTLKNLKTDCLDLQQFHVWRDQWLTDPAWEKTWKTIEDLKTEGKIRYWGVSINDRDPKSALEVVRAGFADTVQVIFNLFEQEPLAELFPACREKNVGVIARVPLDEGGLTGKFSEDTRFEDEDFRQGYFGGGLLKETLRRSKELEKILLNGEAESLAAAALRFCLSAPEVSTVIPGMRRENHVSLNAALSGSPPFSPELLNNSRPHAWKITL